MIKKVLDFLKDRTGIFEKMDYFNAKWINFEKNGLHGGTNFDPVPNWSRDAYTCRFTFDPAEFLFEIMIT